MTTTTGTTIDRNSDKQVISQLKRTKKGKTLAELRTTYYRMLKLEAQGLVKAQGIRETGGRGRPAKEYVITDKGKTFEFPRETKKATSKKKAAVSKKTTTGTKPAASTKGKKKANPAAKAKASTKAAAEKPQKPDVATQNVKPARASQVRSTRSLADVAAAKAGKPSAETRMPGPVNA